MNLKTKIYLFCSLGFLLFSGSGLIYLNVIQRNSKNITASKDKIGFLIGLQSMNPAQMIIILFSPTCEHCQYEAQEIKNHIQDFGDTKIIMVSSDDSISVKKFAVDYQLDNIPNVQFLYLPKEKIFEAFGSTSIPRILIYNREGNLVKDFKGETKIENILKHIGG